MSPPEISVSGEATAEHDPDLTDAGRKVEVDLFRSMLRLAVGGSIEVVDVLRQWLEEEAAQSGAAANDRPSGARPTEQRALPAGVALLFASARTVQGGLSRAAHASGTVARSWREASSPVRRWVGSRVSDQAAALERLIEYGRTEVWRSRSLARFMMRRAIDRVVDHLSGSRAVDGLVRTVASDYMRHLRDHPEAANDLVQALVGDYLAYLDEHPEELDDLIRLRGDRYIEYLRRNPEKVQELVTRQSSGMAADVVEGVRARMVSADGVFEEVARSLLHRTPREKLPEPPPAVQARAKRATLPSDLNSPGVGEDAGR